MTEIEKPIEEVQVVHHRSDDFRIVFELQKEDGTAFDPAELSLTWIIRSGSDLLIEMSGTDVQLEDNVVTFIKAKSFFEDLSFLKKYQHRLYDAVTETTFFQGPFLLK